MNLTAVFESWHIGDGNYPPLHVGQLVNLAFQVEPNQPLEATSPESRILVSDDGECSFQAQVLWTYKDGTSSPVAALEAGDFRFYIESDNVSAFRSGQWVRGAGTILLDYYIWSEFLCKETGAPDLFRNLRVERIRRVRLPEQYVSRSGSAVSYPTRVAQGKYDAASVHELKTMEGGEFGPEFYLIGLVDEISVDGAFQRTFAG